MRGTTSSSYSPHFKGHIRFRWPYHCARMRREIQDHVGDLPRYQRLQLQEVSPEVSPKFPQTRLAFRANSQTWTEKSTLLGSCLLVGSRNPCIVERVASGQLASERHKQQRGVLGKLPTQWQQAASSRRGSSGIHSAPYYPEVMSIRVVPVQSRSSQFRSRCSEDPSKRAQSTSVCFSSFSYIKMIF